MPTQCTEADFNSDGSSFKYNDIWLGQVKQTFKKVNKSVVNFLDKWVTPVDPAVEEKLNLAVIEEIDRLIEKIRLECNHVTATLDSTFKKLYILADIVPSQSQVYLNLQHQLISVIDNKVPNLFYALSQSDGSHQQEAIKKAKSDFFAFEDKEKSRLYQLFQ